MENNIKTALKNANEKEEFLKIINDNRDKITDDDLSELTDEQLEWVSGGGFIDVLKNLGS